MSVTENDHPLATIESVLKRYNILPQVSSLDKRVQLEGEAGTQFSLGDALNLTPKDLLSVQLTIISIGESKTLAPQRHGRGLRPRREIAAIRKTHDNERANLLAEGPGRILAAIAANPEKPAKWTRVGLTGNEDWVKPPEEENAWWNWIYRKKQTKEVDIEKLYRWDKIDILRAVFIMRFRRQKGGIDTNTYKQFVGEIDTWLPEEDEELEGYLREITRRPSI